MKIFKFITDTGEGMQCSLHTSLEELTEKARFFVNEHSEMQFPAGTTLDRLFDYYQEFGLGGLNYMNWNSEEFNFPTDDKLARCYDALQRCIAGLDMHDQFGDDIDARHEAEEDAFHAAKNALPDNDPQECFAIVGRFAFDDEDTSHIFWADSEDDAIRLWKSALRDEDSGNENDLIVTGVFRSFAQIH